VDKVNKKPNILLITTDSQRCDTLAFMGSSFAHSPCLDRLAKDGVWFEQAHTSSPVCAPARCSLLTGVHTPIHGCLENGISRHTHLPVFPDLLKEAGYTNIMVGKTHFGPMPDSFNVYVSADGKSAEANDDYAKHILGHNSRVSSHPNSIPEDLFIDSFIAETTIREIERVSVAGKVPFFAYCSMISPHAPLDPPEPWAGMFTDIELPPVNVTEGEIEQLPLHMKQMLGIHEEKMSNGAYPIGHGKHLEEAAGTSYSSDLAEAIDGMRKLYYGLSAYCDEQVGKLIDYLDRSGLRENTLVIFSSDHGVQLFDHGFNDKHNFFDASWRVPFIMSMPGTLPQGKKRQFASWNDIPTTILAVAGTACPSMQGFDLYTPLVSGEPNPRSCASSVLYQSAAVVSANWKLEYYFSEQEGRMIHRTDDPLERINLFLDPQYSEVKSNLLEALLSWRAELADIYYLMQATSGGGPVAQRVAMMTARMRGVDAERRLNTKMEQIELIFR
jgi:arylsulfatase A-like enzyme